MYLSLLQVNIVYLSLDPGDECRQRNCARCAFCQSVGSKDDPCGVGPTPLLAVHPRGGGLFYVLNLQHRSTAMPRCEVKLVCGWSSRRFYRGESKFWSYFYS